MERRIAAILAADMVGFSRLIEQDETGTLRRQKEYRLDLIEPTVRKWNGRIIKLTGDGLIAEFNSVVEATQSAVEIQSEMNAREANVADERSIRYRIGIHLGDIVFDDGDVYGDGVNVAARLEALAEPGGIVVSGTAHDLLKSQVEVGYRSLGEKKLKNIAMPVRVYQVTNAAGVAGRSNTRTSMVRVAAAVLIVGVSAVGANWWLSRPDFTPAHPENIAFAIPDKPSIAVTPFVNLSSGAEHDWLSKGLSSSVITALTSSPDMVVISRNELDDMRGIALGKIAERYGVRYVLDGTVQSDGKRLRVGARLANALEGRTLWADQWDRELVDVFAIQDEIADAILEELQVKLTLGEQARSWRTDMGSPDNMRDLIRGREAFQTFRPSDHELVLRYWGAMYERNPELPAVMSLQGWIHWHRVLVGLSDDPPADLAKAQEWAQKAINGGFGGQPHMLHAAVDLLLGRHEEALRYAEKGFAADPGDADIVMMAGWVYARAGKLKDGIELKRRAMRLEPDYPEWLISALGISLLQDGQWDDAGEIAEAILASDARDRRAKPRALSILTAISYWEGNEALAHQHMEALLDLSPNLTRERMHSLFSTASFSDQDYVNRFLDTLVAAGLPTG